MSQLHKFKFEPFDEIGRGIVTIDDNPIKCRGFELKHYVNEVPSVNIEVVCVPQIEENAIINVSNKEEIAALMGREEFEEEEEHEDLDSEESGAKNHAGNEI